MKYLVYNMGAIILAVGIGGLAGNIYSGLITYGICLLFLAFALEVK